MFMNSVAVAYLGWNLGRFPFLTSSKTCRWLATNCSAKLYLYPLPAVSSLTSIEAVSGVSLSPSNAACQCQQDATQNKNGTHRMHH